MLSILPCGFCSCVPFSSYHCHWHGGILAFASTIPPGSWCVTTATHSLYHVPFCHLWNHFHLFSFVATEKMQPPPRVQLVFDFSLLLLLAGDVSLNPGPGVCGFHLGTVNARAMQDKVPALSDLVPSKSIDLLGITETWLTMKETSADLADMTPRVSPSFTNLEHNREGEEWACSCHQPIHLQQSVFQSKQVSRQYLANLNVVSYALLSSISITHLVLLPLSSVSYKIFCLTYLHSLMIWL